MSRTRRTVTLATGIGLALGIVVGVGLDVPLASRLLDTSRVKEGRAVIAGARYGHTNLIAQDWRRLARFYEEQFGCVPVPPERDFKGADLERGTGIPHVALRGAHLRLPGYGPDGPTLEIFNYNLLKERPQTAVNRPGFGHIAFVVDDVPAAREAVLAAGGRPVGDVVTLTTATGAKVTWVYVADPEGNVIELQSWSR
ncbi:MAG: VOC family protein [Vicinamibacterales bacterium]